MTAGPQRFRQGAAAAMGAAWMLTASAAWVPAWGQSLAPEGQTLPVYDDSGDFLRGSDSGPALAPTESPDGDQRFADGTEASQTPRIAPSPARVRIAPSAEPAEGAPATVLADSVTLDLSLIHI